MLLTRTVQHIVGCHSLGMPFVLWFKAIVATMARASANHVLGENSPVDELMTMGLSPLKKFLNERVECFLSAAVEVGGDTPTGKSYPGQIARL